MAERKQHPIQKRIRKFSRVEKAFYGSIVLTSDYPCSQYCVYADQAAAGQS